MRLAVLLAVLLVACGSVSTIVRVDSTRRTERWTAASLPDRGDGRYDTVTVVTRAGSTVFEHATIARAGTDLRVAPTGTDPELIALDGIVSVTVTRSELRRSNCDD